VEDFIFSVSVKLSIVIPCFNEEKTIKECVERVLEIADDNLSLELIIVDDHSTDNSYSIARKLEINHPEIKIIRHEKNSGKGAALRSGFKMATGDFVAVQDADLEYDPVDLKRLLIPLVQGDADVVLGSRFLSTGFHRVLYFWHYMGNRFLTFLSNMFTDLNLTDMETCYKVFRREIIQDIDIKENRFGFEPEIIAKIAQRRLRIFEMGISYRGRTYEEGKKIGVKDGFRTLYCIFRYNAHKAPLPIQLCYSSYHKLSIVHFYSVQA
jgi:glycosyltransferase involved in cell wall biosynthesis